MATKQTNQIIAGFNVEKEAQRLWKILQKQTNKKLWILPRLEIVRRHREVSSGYFCNATNKVNLQLGTDTISAWVTLAHELNHAMRFDNHDKKFYQSLRQLTEKRWNITISAFDWNKYGYACDSSIEDQLRQKDCVKF